MQSIFTEAYACACMMVASDFIRGYLILISLYYEKRNQPAAVEQIYLSASKEVLNVTIADKVYQVQSNRSLVKADQYSKKKPAYKAVSATVEQIQFFKLIISAIQSHIKNLERPSYDLS